MTTPAYRVDVRGIDDFSARAFHELLKLRCDVFVVEQKCPYPELDGKDVDALHLRLLDGDDLMAAARILTPHDDGEPVKIGRVVVSPAHRGKRLGETLMREAMAACDARFPGHVVALSAQNYLRRFYESLGFVATSEVYVEDDIPHIDMQREARAQ